MKGKRLIDSEYKEVLQKFIESTLELNEDISQHIKVLKQQKQPKEKLTHDTIRMIQEWFRLNGRLPL
jgi:hypothetical protein